jgi:hypothetical protein
MPLRLNLLAEAQAEEELRRRDPVKRGIMAGIGLVVLVFLWAGFLQFRIMRTQSQINEVEVGVALQNKNFKKITQDQKDLNALTWKLRDLDRYATNRFLWGNLLNALQKAVTTDVQLTRFLSEQSHAITEEIKPKTNAETGRVIIGKPGESVERIRLQFDARDFSPSPGDQVGAYKAALANSEYFRRLLGKTNEIVLRNLSAPTVENGSSRAVVLFTLDCRLPDKLIIAAPPK